MNNKMCKYDMLLKSREFVVRAIFNYNHNVSMCITCQECSCSQSHFCETGRFKFEIAVFTDV